MHSKYSVRRKHEGMQLAVIGRVMDRFRCISFVSGACLLCVVIGYLVVVNRNAVSGYSLRSVEKRMLALSNESQKLRIREAELCSLYGLKEASNRLDMKPIEDALSLDEPGPIAYGR